MICCSGFTCCMILKDWPELYFLDINLFLSTSYFLLLNMQNIFRFVPQWFYVHSPVSLYPSLSVHELCSHPSFTYCHHTWLLLRDRLTRLAFTMTSPLFSVFSEPIQVCVWGHTEGLRGGPGETAQVHAVRIQLMQCQLFPKMMLKFTDRIFSTWWCYSSVTEWWRSISSQEHRT